MADSCNQTCTFILRDSENEASYIIDKKDSKLISNTKCLPGHKVGDVWFRICRTYAATAPGTTSWWLEAFADPQIDFEPRDIDIAFNVKVQHSSSKQFKDLAEGTIRVFSKGIWRDHLGDFELYQVVSMDTFIVEVRGVFALERKDLGCHLGASCVMATMWQDMQFSDFAIVARGGKEIRCHKSVLAAASPVLKGMLSNDMEEGRQGFANIDEDEDDLHSLLQYMYTLSLPTCADHSLLLSVMRLSDLYQVPGLSKVCASRLLPLVGKENLLQVLHELKQFQDVNKDYKQLFKDVQDVVKHDE